MSVRLVLTGLAAFAILAVGVLDPSTTRWLPRCPLHAVTGLYCAGCGATRAAHALLHGELSRALAFNPLLVLAVPAIASAVVVGRIRANRPFPPWAGLLLLAVLIVYGVLRNVPGFEVLGPPR